MSNLFFQRPRPTMLVILDGWGIANDNEGNAVTNADTPFFDELVTKYPVLTLKASGQAVGLPDNIMGNSEVGHLTLGSGRICNQALQKINKSIADGTIMKNQAINQDLDHVQKNKSDLHFIGLVSDGRVHSSLEHLKGLLDWAVKNQVNPYIHCILDGRDTLRDEGAKFVGQLLDYIKEVGVGQIASVSGRFYAMDRDNHWERTSSAYRAMVRGEGRQTSQVVDFIKQSYEAENFDEEFLPTVIMENDKPVGLVKDNDAVIFFNYRADRARQLTKAFVLDEMDKFDRGPKLNNLLFTGFTEYEKGLPIEVAFPKENIEDTLGQVIAEHKLKQLRIAETEKYAHVTYFFNGGKEEANQGEDHILVPSPRVESYASKPEMSASDIVAKVTKAVEDEKYDFILINFANPDMVGHTGDMSAAIKAIQTVDKALEQVVKAVLDKNGAVLVTADHGNSEEMIDLKTHTILKEHSTNPVPFIVVNKEMEGRSLGSSDVPGTDLSAILPTGGLSDIAPTVLKVMGLSKPTAMTGKSLI